MFTFNTRTHSLPTSSRLNYRPNTFKLIDRFCVLFSLLLFLIIFSYSSSVWSQLVQEDSDNICKIAQTCGECIRSSPMCAWCGAKIYSRDLSRCDMVANIENHCDKSLVSNPTSAFRVLRDEPFTSGEKGQPPMQIRPQAVEFTLRPNQQQSFRVTFKQQASYPVDLYFLLDLSFSMHRQKEATKRLITLGNDISIVMRNITDNFRLGFGTFVDKVVMPYTSWTEVMFRDRCPLAGGNCRPPHDFKNQLSLGLNQDSFAAKMRSALETVSHSFDDKEGGMDGLIQALDCGIIGWRSVSRRIIVYSSNSQFHLAGAGILGGATKQNPLKCNLTNNDDTYQGGTIYDYPSVSQIAHTLRQTKTNVIFAVMKNVSSHYRALEKFLDGAVVGELEEDSNNIVQLIKDKYSEIRSRIEFQVSNSDNMDVKFRSKCKSQVEKETSACDNVEIMEAVEFNVTLTVSDDVCVNQVGTVKKEVLLNAVGLAEQISVMMNVRCDCNCETDAKRKTIDALDNVHCSHGNGTFECGICICNSGRFGRQCECDELQLSQESSLEQCKEDGNDSAICNGNGECICGVCECFPIPRQPSSNIFSGTYCGCNNYNCLRGENKELCGGPSKGQCRCGTCECFPGWTGKQCDCTTFEDHCVATNGKICNGAGSCECGRCLCNSTSGMIGPTCEDCLTCPSQCNEYIDCAQCRAFQSGLFSKTEDCDSNCNQYTIQIEKDLPSGDSVRSCSGIDNEDKCMFFFTYVYGSNNDVILVVQETKECPKKLPLAAIIGGTVTAVILLLLLICLLIQIRNWKDRKECAKFKNDQEKARWDSGGNPLYKEQTTTFKNLNYQNQNPTSSSENIMLT